MSSTFSVLFVSLLSSCAFVGVVNSWTLHTTMQGNSFFNHFDFFTGDDPTHGYVDYVSSSTAYAQNYAVVDSSTQVYIGCDHHNIASGRGRQAVRLESTQTWNYGLFIYSGTHMPTGCGTWPAYWMYGPNWPYGGECDIIEGVNNQAYDDTTLHTSNGCDMSNAPKNYTGHSSGTYNCYQPSSNSGCGITNPSSSSYGAGFNNVNGGVYAVEWTSNGFRMWFWEMAHVPSNVYSSSPNPNSWGVPYAAFPFGSWCSSSHFSNMKITINLTFCGDWCGAVFGSQCPGKGDCDDYVKNNPSAFSDAFWEINFIKVYQ